MSKDNKQPLHPGMRVVSGGQTGVDQAALDVAIALEMPHSGWIPAGRWTEDGPLPDRYQNMRQTQTSAPAERTERNVIDSDGTLLFSRGRLTGGSLLTEQLAERHGRPCLCIDLSSSANKDMVVVAARVRSWLETNKIRSLNVAGPRHSKDPEIYSDTKRALFSIFAKEAE